MTNSTLCAPEWTLGDKLRKARQHAGLQQRELAAAMGVSPTTVVAGERGRTIPTLATVRRWAEVTGVPFEWLAS